MLGLLEGIRGGASDARAAEQLQLQREQALRQQQMQDMQIQQMRRAMEREARTQADNDAVIAAWEGQETAPPVGLAPSRNVNAPVGLEPPEPMAAPAGAAPGMPGAAPTGGLSKFDRAVGTAALRSGNFDAAYKLKDRAKAEGQDAGRKAEFKRLMSLSNEELTAAFEPMNANPGFKGMLNFDPKSKQFLLVSQIPGLETQTLTKEELVNSMMGIWEAGNGNFEKGMAALMAGAQRRREIDNSNFDRSGKLAGLNADAYFKGRQADSTDAQRAEQSRHNRAMEGNASARLGLDRSRIESADWKIIGTTADKKGLLYFNERTRQTEARPLPEGADADGLFRKLTGQGQQKPMTELERAQAYKAYVEGGMPPELAQARVNGVDVGAMIAGAVQRKAAEKAKANGKPTQVTAQQAPAKPEVTYETMPLSALRGYTSPEARAVYQRRLAEQQRLSTQPRFWLGNREAAEPPMLGGF